MRNADRYESRGGCVIRLIVNIASVLSLLLCVGTSALWVRSYWTAQFVGWSGPVPWFGVLAMAGEIRCERGDYAASARGWSYAAYPTQGDHFRHSSPGNGLADNST